MYADGGNIQPRKARGTPPRIFKDKVMLFLAKHPDAYLRELALAFGVSIVSMHIALKRFGISYKKNDILRRARRRKT
jgi:transposase